MASPGRSGYSVARSPAVRKRPLNTIAQAVKKIRPRDFARPYEPRCPRSKKAAIARQFARERCIKAAM
jgi:hypothetical protein